MIAREFCFGRSPDYHRLFIEVYANFERGPFPSSKGSKLGFPSLTCMTCPKTLSTNCHPTRLATFEVCCFKPPAIRV